MSFTLGSKLTKQLPQKNSGFSLVGTLIATALLLTLAAYTACSIADAKNTRLQVERDSRELKLWLSERMSFADAASANFSVTSLAKGDGTAKLRLVWTTGPLYAHEEYFAPDKCTLYSSRTGEATYSGEWHTMTPAVTYTISYKSGTKTASQNITVSGQGYVH